MSDSPFLVNNFLYLEHIFITAKEPRTRGSSVSDIVVKTIPLRYMQLILLLNENWSTNPGKFDIKDLLELTLFTCDKHSMTGVTVRLSYRHSHEELLIISEDSDKHYKLQTLEANLYVRKLIVTNHVLSAIESILLKTLHICELYTSRKNYQNISCNSWSAQLETGRCFCS